MPDFPVPTNNMVGVGFLSSLAITGATAQSIGASGAWPAANRAIFCPVIVDRQVGVSRLIIGAGATASGNFDVGIYDRHGNRLVSTGSTVKGTSVEHVISITQTALSPGLYYLALAANATANYVRVSTGVELTRLMGSLQMDTAFPLPATATFAARTSGETPHILAELRQF